ncbi:MULTISPECIES: hypothetical protein [Bacillus]|uniref:hypothetical protein n=1 Tax=Bacillus TaxID=1386 RepID=UPI0012FD94CF|nr:MULTISPECIES: hypothetical protein [Bacillus amyloliquefaciens group]MCB5334795.1 hypothetical protein [Bacillus amyloliquefaciens]MCP9020078.1 hypothetical protein [Bacillus velezensis]MDE5154195.1 hypothetical protein [Bacillus amyloliquefaciens]MEC2352561.1 hypothetical protein [Bacillus velezensis]NCT27976.1 hypothetical protein [Bacillus velezensis]
MITEDRIFEIEEEETIEGYKVRRVNMSELEIIDREKIVFKGEEAEVAEHLNSLLF